MASESIADIVAEMRKQARRGQHFDEATIFAYAEHIEAACRREAASVKPTCDWNVKTALNFANTLANHGWTKDANADAASSCIYALCRMFNEPGNAAAMREALENCAKMGEQIDYQLGSSDETVYAFREERCLGHNISECARAALAAPPRNCDRFRDWDSAEAEYERLVQEGKAEDGTWCEWLFSVGQYASAQEGAANA